MGRCGVGQKLILRMFPRSSVGAWADIRAGGQIGATVQFYLFWRVNWSRVCGRGLSGNNSNQKITKLQARIRIWRGLCGYNSNLVIKRRAGAVFPPLLSAGVIMPRGGAILSILAGRLGGVGRHGLSGNNSKNNQITGVRGLLGNISKNNQIIGTHKNFAGLVRAQF